MAGQPTGTYLAELSKLPTEQTIEYDRKLQIQFWFGVSRMAFRLFGGGFILDVGPVARDKVEKIFRLHIVSCKFCMYFLCIDFEFKSH